MLTIEQLTKSFGEKLLFEHIHAFIEDNDRIGLIGVNGTGKSTLLKIIAGIEPADEGEIIHPNDYRIEYLPQQPQFVEEMTVLDYVFSGNAIMMQVIRHHELAIIAVAEHPLDETKQTQLLNMHHRLDKHEAGDETTVAKTTLTTTGITQINQLTTTLPGTQQEREANAKAFIQPADLLI